MARKQFLQAIKEYKQAVQKRFPLDGFFIFGSFATGQQKKDSDVDVLVVSSSFKPLSGMERLTELSLLRSGAARKVPMDIIGVTPKELAFLKKEQNPFWKQILKTMRQA